MNWAVAIGGVIVFFGYLLFFIGDLLIIRLPQGASYEQYVAVSSVSIAGTLVAGIGFLIALLGLAIRR